MRHRARTPSLRAPLPRAPAPDSRVWGGTLLLHGGCGLYVGRALTTMPHTHHAVQVCIGLDGPFRLRRASAPWREYRGAIVLSDEPHALDGRGKRVALLYLDPESPAARRIACRAARRSMVPLGAATRAALLARLRRLDRAAISTRLCDDLIDALGAEGSTPARVDARVAAAVDLLRAAPDRRVLVSDVAAAVRLSPSRLARLFRADMGLSIRRYLLWLRLGDALRQLGRGTSLTTAAHGAGFADSAHFSRTFRRMLGITPSELRRHGEFVQDVPLARS